MTMRGWLIDCLLTTIGVLLTLLLASGTLRAESFDGSWQGTYEITKNYTDFECQGGDVEVRIKQGAVALETRNPRSHWIYKGSIDEDGRLQASGRIGDRPFDAMWSAQLTGNELIGTFEVKELCAGNWSAARE
jgi:hypothetical protein